MLHRAISRVAVAGVALAGGIAGVSIPAFAAQPESATAKQSSPFYYFNTDTKSFSLSNVDAEPIPMNGVLKNNVGRDNRGWYVVNGNVSIPSRIEVTGDIRLILADGATLTAKEGIHLPASQSLTIYGGEKKTGKLVISARGGGSALIGGNGGSTQMPETCGNLNIHSGSLDVTSEDSFTTAIGGGYGTKHAGGNGCTFTMYGGSVRASATGDGAAIGGGAANNQAGGNGGTVNIFGGTVRALSSFGAAIGGAGSSHATGGNGGTVNISGGTIDVEANHAAAIGGGSGIADDSNGGAVSITGGLVSAHSGDSPAIGAGLPRHSGSSNSILNNGTFNVSGRSVVMASSGSSAAIGDQTKRDQWTGIITETNDKHPLLREFPGHTEPGLTSNIPLNGALTIAGEGNSVVVPPSFELDNNGKIFLRNKGSLTIHGDLHGINSSIENNGGILVKKTPTAPAVDVTNKTTTTITLKEVKAPKFRTVEYSLNGKWQDNPYFSGLKPNTEYSIMIRVNGNAYYETAESAATPVRTEAVKPAVAPAPAPAPVAPAPKPSTPAPAPAPAEPKPMNPATPSTPSEKPTPGTSTPAPGSEEPKPAAPAPAPAAPSPAAPEEPAAGDSASATPAPSTPAAPATPAPAAPAEPQPAPAAPINPAPAPADPAPAAQPAAPRVPAMPPVAAKPAPAQPAPAPAQPQPAAVQPKPAQPKALHPKAKAAPAPAARSGVKRLPATGVSGTEALGLAALGLAALGGAAVFAARRFRAA